MALIVEDGTGLSNANSYVSVADARTWAADRGLTLPTDDAVLSSYLIQATDFIGSYETQFKGERTVPATQALSWPRNCVDLFGVDLPNNVIPQQLVAAQVQAAVAITAGVVLQPNMQASDYVIREKVGPLETEYSDPNKVGLLPTLTAFENAIAPLLQGGGGFWQTVRV